MIFKWLRLISLVFFLYPFSAQADLKIGVMFFDPPLVFSANQGFHIALAQTLCERLKEKCTIIPMVWSKLFPSLIAREIDLIMGVFITPERAKNYLFSIPYMASKGGIIVRVDSKISQYEQLAKRKVGTLKEEEGNGVFFNFISANFGNTFQLVEFPDVSNLLTALLKNSIQAGIFHLTSIEYWVANSDGVLKILGPPFDLGSGYSIMALVDKQNLISRINEQIRILKSSGDFNKLYYTYFLEQPD